MGSEIVFVGGMAVMAASLAPQATISRAFVLQVPGDIWTERE